MRYIALLRGINVGGKNRVPMLDLKECFEVLGFENVHTYINSGNVIFDSEQTNKVAMVNECEEVIEKKFGFRVVCSVIRASELHDALKNAPSWWGIDDGVKHDALFVIAPVTAKEIAKEFGDTKPEYEKVAIREPIIFWSVPLKTYGRTRYSKIIGTKPYAFVTIRNSNTTKKLAELSQEGKALQM